MCYAFESFLIRYFVVGKVYIANLVLFCRFLRVIETSNRNGKAWSGKNLAVFSSLQESLKQQFAKQKLKLNTTTCCFLFF